MGSGGKYELVFAPTFERAYRRVKKKKATIAQAVAAHLPKLIRNPELGKPLRHSLRNYRRIHVQGSFVLVYEVNGNTVRLIDLDHHDRIYKKYS